MCTMQTETKLQGLCGSSSMSANKIIPVSDEKWGTLVYPRCTGSNYGSVCPFSPLDALNNDRIYDQVFCDFTIVTELRRFPVHKCIVGVASDFFKKAITTEMKEKYEQVVTVFNVKPDVMEVVLDYVYGKEIAINNDNIDDLFAASDFLQIYCLNSVCAKFISKTSLTMKNCWAVWAFAKQNDFPELLERCKSFVKTHFLHLSEQEMFLTAPANLIESFFELREETVLETTLYQLIIKWVEYDEEERQLYFSKLFKLVNLDDIEPSYVASNISDNKLVSNNLECLQKVTKILRNTTKFLSTNELFFVESCDFTVTVYKFDVLLKRTLLTSSLSKNIEKHAIALKKNILYVIGGHASHTLNSYFSLYSLNLRDNTWETKDSMNQKRSRFGCTVMENFLYVAGGQAHQQQILDMVECYNIRRDIWTSKASMIYKRAGCCLIEHNNYLYALGGETTSRSNSKCSHVEKFDGNEWTRVESMLMSRSNFAAVILEDAIYVVGGEISDGHSSESVEVYKIQNEDSKWVYIDSLNYARKGHSACVMNGNIYVVGGTDSDDDAVTDVEIYTPSVGIWLIFSNCDSENVAVVANR